MMGRTFSVLATLSLLLQVCFGFNSWGTVTFTQLPRTRRSAGRGKLCQNALATKDNTETVKDFFNPLEPSNYQRNMTALQEWAMTQGVLVGEHFELVPPKEGDDENNWSVQTTTRNDTSLSPTQEGIRMLQIPPSLIFSSQKIRDDLTARQQKALEPAIQHLKNSNCQLQVPQFYLVLQVLRQLELGSESVWFPWIQSLPSQFSTAVSMDEVELECLPPFAWSLAQIERFHCQEFTHAFSLLLNTTDDDDSSPLLLSRQTLENHELLEWAFNAVFTRCWAQDGDDDYDRCHMVPMGDMFNHADPANVFVYYDEPEDGNSNEDFEASCNILLKEGVTPGTPLSLSYGKSTDPSRFLTVFGFVDRNQPYMYSQIVVNNPAEEHTKMGYDRTKLVFGTQDGVIANEVWNLLLYTILDQSPGQQKVFYEAHTGNQTEIKAALLEQYRLETCLVLKKHVDETLQSLATLLQNMDEMYAKGEHVGHDRLPMIYTHNAFIYRTFAKVKSRVDNQIQVEVARRKSTSQAQ